jgi:hypothetical protein
MRVFKRTLADGRDVDVGRNHGVRKVCGCPRRLHAKCAHSWYLNFSWQGQHHRFSLDKYTGRRIESRTEAEAIADELRAAIRSGEFGRTRSASSTGEPGTPLTFESLPRRGQPDAATSWFGPETTTTVSS